MKYDLAYYLEVIKKNQLTTISDLRKKFRHLHTYYCRHKTKIGALPLIQKKRPNNTLTKEICFKAALKYMYRSDFQKNDKGAYSKALRQGWLHEICAHMISKPYEAKGGNPGKPAHNRIDIVGQRFGDWLVLARAGVGKGSGWTCQCKCGTISEIPTANLKLNLSTKCSKCSNQISQPMKDLHNHICNLGFNANLSDKQYGFEIDILVPEKQFFIEYDGLLWHSSKFRATATNEIARYSKFKAAGLTGIRVFEDQYLRNPELVRQMIANRLGVKSKSLPENVMFHLVQSPSEYRQFCDTYHLDGYGRSSWAVVAKNHDGIVLAFMGFRPYMAGQFKGQPELSRFCTNYNYNCYGLFGKMLKLAVQHIKLQKLGNILVSASDNHISNGKVYANNGFTQHGADSPNWFYYLHSKGARMHRAIGKRLKPPKITQEEFCQYATEKQQVESGFLASKKFGRWEPMYKIYGWGQKLWVRKLK